MRTRPLSEVSRIPAERLPFLSFLRGGPAYYAAKTVLLPLFVGPSDSSSDYPLLKDDDRFSTMFRNTVRNFTSIVEPFSGEIDWPLGKAYNGWFEAADAELYYCMVRTWKPQLIIEVGTGNSAWIASEALKKNQQGRLIAIDPRPRTRLPPGTLIIKKTVQNIPVKTFSRLRANDILFVDSSHTTGEARYHCEQILPTLR